MINLEIDGKPVQIDNGRTVIDAANKLGIYIPHFCYHKKLSIAANCRMCLVQVEKAPKPLPACATPVTEGMKVSTHSEFAVKAQKSVMEFLLINHPLDCPICDQGGECQLQDLAVGYGASNSRYAEDKRVVVNKDLGPLISTDMTRCIHCTRCVRFGQEIAGVMELGMIGRGEHAEITQFVDSTVDSELSGNMIDVCPVGALTSKPFRYSARTWELSRYRSISPHDGLGTNLILQVMQNRVMRVVPQENEEVNECWLSDRDRFSYEGLNSEERLREPLVKQNGQWRPTDWQHALELVASSLKKIAEQNGADAIGALATPHQTLEELYLLQKLARELGTGNVDHRLRQSDFSLDVKLQSAPWLGMPVADLPNLQSVLIIGSTLRKEHPLLASRLRQAAKKGADINLLNPIDDALLMRVANKMIVAPSGMPQALAQLLKLIAQAKQTNLPAQADAGTDQTAQRMAASLAGKERCAVLLGNIAQHHPGYAQIYALAQETAALLGARIGVLGEAANSVGAHVAGAIPYAGPCGAQARKGLNTQQMLATPRKAYLLLGVEADSDCYDPRLALDALKSADFVVAMSAYQHRALDYAHVLLPIAPFTETAGTFISTEGRIQSFNGVVKPLGEARPAWKVLRVLASLLGLRGFEYDSVEAIRNAISPELATAVKQHLDNRIDVTSSAISIAPGANAALERIGEIPIYRADALVRRAASLQRTRDAQTPRAWMSGVVLELLGITAGSEIRLRQGQGEARLTAARDDSLPSGTVRVAAAHPLTSTLGPMFGEISVEPA